MTMPDNPSSGSKGGFLGAPPPKDGAFGPCVDCNLLAEADHRIANHLALLRSYVGLKDGELARLPAEPSRDSMRLILASVDAQIQAVGQLHRALAAQGRRTSADLAEHLHTTCAPFMAGLSGPTTISEDFEAGCIVQADQALALTQIVAEVITNALKHAHGSDGDSAILVRCRKGALGGVLIEVIDNGPGLPEGFDPAVGGGLGFRLLRALSKQLGAITAFRTTPAGLQFQLALPAPPSPMG